MAFELPPHLAQVLGSFAAREDFVSMQAAKIQEQHAAVRDATDVMLDRTAKAADAAQVVAADKSAQAAALEDRLVRLGSTMMPDEVRFANATAIGQAADVFRNQLARVQELESVSFFDNPLAYLVNSVQVPREATKLAQAEQTVELLTTQQQRIAAATTADAQAMRATARTLTDAGRAAELEQLRHAADAELARIDRDAAKDNINMSLQLLNLDKEQREPLERAYVLNRDEQRWQASYEMQKEAADRARTAANDEKATDEALMSMLQDAANYASAVAGDERTAGMLLSITDVKQLRAQQQMKTPLFERFLVYAQNAAASQYAPGGKVLGRNLLDSLDNVSNLRIPVSKGEEEVLSAVRVAQALEAQNNPQWNSLSPAEKEERKAAVAMKAVADLPVMSPKKLALLESAGKSPVGDLKIAQIPGIKNDDKAWEDFGSLMKAAGIAAREPGANPVELAQDIVTLASRARMHTNIERNYEGMGVPAPKQVAIVPPGTRQAVDATNLRDVLMYIVQESNPRSVFSPEGAREFGMRATVSPVLAATYAYDKAQEAKARTAAHEKALKEAGY